MKKMLTTSLLSGLSAATLWLTPAWARLEDNLRFTPPQADAFLALSTAPQDWQYFLDRKPFSSLFEEGMKEVLLGLSKEFGLDVEKDLKPLLGSHVSVAVYHDAQNNEKNLLPLVAMDVKDPSVFTQIVAKIKQKSHEKKDAHLLEIPVQGSLFYGFSSSLQPEDAAFFMTLSSNTLLFGSRAMLEKALEAGNNGKNLTQDNRFASTFKSLGKEKLWFYMNPRNLEHYLKMIPNTSDLEIQEALKQIKQSFGSYDSFGMGLDLNARGLRFKSFVTLSQDGPDTPERKYLRQAENAVRNPQASLRELMKAAPERPLFFAAGQGFHLMPLAMKTFLHNQPKLKEVVDEIFYKGFRALTQLDLERDILAHSDGRVGLSVFYPEMAKTINQPPHMVIYLGVKNNPQFLKTLQNKLMLDFDALEVTQNSTTRKKKQRMTITFPQIPQARYRGAPLYMSNLTPTAQGLKREMGIQAGYTHVGNLWFFGSNLEALKASVDYVLSHDSNLMDNGYFTALREKYGMQEDTGMFFVDLGKVVNLVKLFMGEDEEIQTLLPTLQAMKSLTAGGSYRDDGAEGVFLFDVDMSQIDFELLGKLLGEITSKSETEEKAETPVTP